MYKYSFELLSDYEFIKPVSDLVNSISETLENIGIAKRVRIQAPIGTITLNCSNELTDAELKAFEVEIRERCKQFKKINITEIRIVKQAEKILPEKSRKQNDN